jgi:hypothetical protein
VLYAAVLNLHSGLPALVATLHSPYETKKKLCMCIAWGFVVDKMILDQSLSTDLGSPLVVIFHE